MLACLSWHKSCRCSLEILRAVLWTPTRRRVRDQWLQPLPFHIRQIAWIALFIAPIDRALLCRQEGQGAQNPWLVDTEGLPLRVVVHSAGIQDRDGAALVLDKDPQSLPLARTRLGRYNGYNAWQVETAVAKVPALRLRQAQRRPEGLRRLATSLGRRANLLLIWP
jgi:hypothetical protein